MHRISCCCHPRNHLTPLENSNPEPELSLRQGLPPGGKRAAVAKSQQLLDKENTTTTFKLQPLRSLAEVGLPNGGSRALCSTDKQMSRSWILDDSTMARRRAHHYLRHIQLRIRSGVVHGPVTIGCHFSVVFLRYTQKSHESLVEE